MNPLTKVKLINELNEREAKLGIKETVSWHSEYKDSAWIFVGGFPYELSEGDIICVFSQYGEVVNINLVRDKKTGKSKGFCFICYEDQRSTILAVDNFNGIKIKGRTIRVDHVKDYKPPKDHEDIDDITKQLREQGCAPKVAEPASSESEDEQYVIPVKKTKKDKKEKKKKKKEKKEKKKAEEREQASRSQRSSSSSSTPPPAVKVKQEKEDLAYDKYNQWGAPEDRRTGRGEMDRKEDDRGQHACRGDQGNGERSREGERVREDERRRDRVGERREGGNGQQRESKRAGREEGEILEHRDRVRESDQIRERDRDGDGGNERERDRPREKDREPAYDRHWERETYSENIRERGGERSRDRERERSRERERGRDRSRERDGERSKDWERERNRNRERERDRERERPGKHGEHSREREYRRT